MQILLLESVQRLTYQLPDQHQCALKHCCCLYSQKCQTHMCSLHPLAQNPHELFCIRHMYHCGHRNFLSLPDLRPYTCRSLKNTTNAAITTTTIRNVRKPFFFINFDIAVAISFHPFSFLCVSHKKKLFFETHN